MYSTLCFPKRVTALSKNCIIFKLSGLGTGSSKEPAHQRSGNRGLREYIIQYGQIHDNKIKAPDLKTLSSEGGLHRLVDSRFVLIRTQSHDSLGFSDHRRLEMHRAANCRGRKW